MRPAVTIAITRHDEPDSQLLECLESLRGQRAVMATVLCLDQCASAEIEQYCAARADGDTRFVYHALAPCGISRARNEALALCNTDFLLFTEPDARADANWAHSLCQTLAAGAAVVGGRILPDWEGRPPIGAHTGLIMDQYSLLDLGEGTMKNAKVVGCNFGINIALLGSRHAYFDESYGHAPGSMLGGEEMDLCNRAAGAGLAVMYNGGALVRHQIAKERSRYRWLARRLYAAGQSRALRGGKPKPTNPGGFCWASFLIMPLYLFYALGFARRKLQPLHRPGTQGS